MIRTTNNLFGVLCVLFSNKNLTYHDISRKTGLSVMGISKIINKLSQAGIVDIETIGAQPYSAFKQAIDAEL